MVSAVFHSPSDADDARASAPSRQSHPVSQPTTTSTPAPRTPKVPVDWAGMALKALAPLAGLALLVAIWALLTVKSEIFQRPWRRGMKPSNCSRIRSIATARTTRALAGTSCFRSRVAMGFGLAAVVGDSIGF